MSDTPETDDVFKGEWNHAYLFSRMRKLERERDAAVESLKIQQLAADAAHECNAEMERLEADATIPHNRWHELEAEHARLLARADIARAEVLACYPTNDPTHATGPAGEKP